MSYRNLEIWKLARELSIEIHTMTLTLPKFEQFEEGQQIRRSSKSVCSNIVEGYGRRIYKQEFIKFVAYSLSSNDETIEHLELLFQTHSLRDEIVFKNLKAKAEMLGKKINSFLKTLPQQHNNPPQRNAEEPDVAYNLESVDQDPESSVHNPFAIDQNPWTTLSQEDIYENPWIKLEQHRVINPSGGEGIYGKVHFKNTAIGIIPLDDKNNTWLVGQHRYVLNEWSWEIPEGGGPAGKSILDSAKRELLEETGLKATHWKEILKAHLSNSVSDEVGYIFLAQGLTEGDHKREATEADMKVWKLPFTEALEMVMNGKITDGLSVMGILKASKLLGL